MEQTETNGSGPAPATEVAPRSPIRTILEKLMTFCLFLFACVLVGIVFIGLEHEHDRKNRNLFGAQLLHFVMEIEDVCPALAAKEIDVMQFRYMAKQKIVEMYETQSRMGIGTDYRKDPWTVMGSFFYVLTTTTTIGYGYPVPKTPEGRIMAIILFVIGVPLTFIAVMDLVEIIFLCERLIGLKIHNNTVEFREKLRLFLLKICFWCKIPPEEEDTHHVPRRRRRRKRRLVGWKRRLNRKKRKRKRKGLEHWINKSIQRKAMMEAMGYFMEESDTDTERPKKTIVYRKNNKLSLKKNAPKKSKKERKKTAKKGVHQKDVSSSDENKTVRKRKRKVKKQKPLPDIKEETLNVTKVDLNALTVPDVNTNKRSSYTDVISKCNKGAAAGTKDYVMNNQLVQKSPSEVSRRSCPASVIYIDENIIKRPLKSKSCKTLATHNASCSKGSDADLRTVTSSNNLKEPKHFVSDSQIYERPHHNAYSPDFTYNFPGNYNECNNQKQSKSWPENAHGSSTSSSDSTTSFGWLSKPSHCVIQMEDDDDWSLRKPNEELRAKSLSDSYLHIKSGKNTLPFNRAYSACNLAAATGDAAGFLPVAADNVEGANVPVLVDSASRFDFNSSSQEFDQIQTSDPEAYDVEAGQPLGLDYFVREYQLNEEESTSQAGFPEQTWTYGLNDDLIDAEVAELMTRKYYRNDPEIYSSDTSDIDKVQKDPASVLQYKMDPDLVVKEKKKKRAPPKSYQIKIGGRTKTVYVKQFTKKRSRPRSPPPVKTLTFVSYPLDPVLVAVNPKASNVGSRFPCLGKPGRLRKKRKAVRMVPPDITVTTPEKRTKMILNRKTCSVPQLKATVAKGPRVQRKLRSRRNRRKKVTWGRPVQRRAIARTPTPLPPPPPPRRFGEDTPDSRMPEISFGFTIANLVFYMLFGAIMYVKVEGWSYLDAVYFMFTSISTVGYGDLLPTTAVFQLLSSLYILLGLALLAKVVNDIRGNMASVMIGTEQAILKKIEKVGHTAVMGIARSARRVTSMAFGRRRTPEAAAPPAVQMEMLELPVTRSDSSSAVSLAVPSSVPSSG